MFKSLKDKLKGWISKTQEETEEKIVETPKEDQRKTKEAKKEVKETKKKTEKKTKEELGEELSEKIEDKLEEAVEDTKEDLEDALSAKHASDKSQSKSTSETSKKEAVEDIQEKDTKDQEIQEQPKEEKKKEAPSEEKPKEEIKEEKKVEELEEKGDDEKTEKKGFFSGWFSKKKEDEVAKEEVKEVVEKGKVEHEEIERPKEDTLKEQLEKEIEPEKEKPKEEEKNEIEEIIEKEKPKQGFSLFGRKSLTEEKFEELFDELEMILLQNNVAYEAINNIKKSLKEKLVGESAKTDIETALKESIEELLINPPNLIEQVKSKDKKPFVILFAGINGAGKTTTIAKVAHLMKKNNFSVCLASADTFRAAAIEQLQVHADRLEVPLVKKDYGADPASVGFDALKYAEKNKIDVVMIDTAGRMNNRDSLMKEIEKISRVNKPDLKIFLGESITGNDATEQARDFNEAISIDGIILSKADVDEKGGTAISVAQVTGKPIYYLGTGQKYEDLEIFDKEKLVDKIFS